MRATCALTKNPSRDVPHGQRAPVLRLPYQSRVLSANLELLEFLSTEEADIAIAFRTLPAQQGPAWVAPRRRAGSPSSTPDIHKPSQVSSPPTEGQTQSAF